ncbi:hypothetical protein QEZ52_15905 [Aliisedimentitalea scapharcae]|uniref:Uncharacterized protein n=1 Tax=Aliisedimentitalea scapharcae TaxID=1524259 RepID=A0ABZ2XQB1_9RHOB
MGSSPTIPATAALRINACRLVKGPDQLHTVLAHLSGCTQPETVEGPETLRRFSAN